SHRRVSHAIANTLNEPSDVSLSYCARAIDGTTYRGASMRRRMRSFTRRALGRSVHWSFASFRDVFSNSWENSDKYFNLSDVARIAGSIEPLARIKSRDAWSDVAIRPAADVANYRFGYR